MIDHGPEVAVGRVVDAQLAIGAGAVVEHVFDGLDVCGRAEFVDLFGHQFQKFAHELAGRHFFILAEVDHLAVQPIAHGPPLVLQNQFPPVDPKRHVPAAQLPEPEHDGLEQGRDGDGLIGPRADVADSEFQSGVLVVRAYVPPNFAGVGNAAGIDQRTN